MQEHMTREINHFFPAPQPNETASNQDLAGLRFIIKK